MAEFLAREAGVKPIAVPDSETRGRPWRKLLTILPFLVGGLAIGWLTGKFIVNKSDEQLLPIGWQLLIAFLALFIFWLPLHEAIHALFFKWLGADKVGFGYSNKGMMVYAYSQRFVMPLRENALVAAMPFLLITTTLVVLLVKVPGLHSVWVLTLLLHTLGCMGDFILIKHAWKNRHEGIYTYDDLEEKRTYFFKKK